MSGQAGGNQAKAAMTEEEKAAKAAEKAKRKAEFEAKRGAELSSANQGPSQGKSKAELRKERNEKQAAQRAAKNQTSTTTVPKPVVKPDPVPPSVLRPDAKEFKPSMVTPQLVTGDTRVAKEASEVVKVVVQDMKSLKIDDPKDVTIKPSACKPQQPSLLNMFPEIPSKCCNPDKFVNHLGFNHKSVHSSFIKLGLRRHQNLINSSLDSCLSLMVAVKDTINDYRTPQSKVLNRDLVDKLNENLKFLKNLRPITISMDNCIKKVLSDVTELNPDLNEDESRKFLMDSVDKFIKEEISCALQAVTIFGSSKLSNMDTILTFGHSIEVQHILYNAYVDGKSFDVIVVDSNPERTGLRLVEFLCNLDGNHFNSECIKSGSEGIKSGKKWKKRRINISYIYINSIVHVINNASKVLIGADAIFSNGYVMARTGSAQVALIANKHNVPVIVICETFAFSDSVPTDAFIFNENGLATDYKINDKTPKKLLEAVRAPETKNNLSILDLKYDLTPPDFVSMVITEIGIFPSSAVSAVIRRKFLAPKFG